MAKKALLAIVVTLLASVLVAVPGCANGAGPGSNAAPTLPEGFPADVPVYDGTIVDSAEADADGGTAYTVELTASDTVEDVVSWYEDELAGEGWVTATASMPNGTGNVITGDKEGQSVVVTVLEGDNGTDMSVDYSPAD